LGQKRIEIPVNSRIGTVLVYGRRSEFGDNDIRRGPVEAQTREDFKIIKFDSLAEGLRGKVEKMIGVRHNEFIDLMTDDVVDAHAFSLLEPSDIRVRDALWHKLKNGPRSNCFVSEGRKEVEALGWAADRVRRRPK
jgi:hypothetical protein